MLWSTSPVATELETLVLDWLVTLLDLPQHFIGAGVIQDTASSATLCALLAAREQATEGAANTAGLTSLGKQLTLYTSDQSHSSIEKAVMVSGIGRENLRIIKSDHTGAMIPDALDEAINADIRNGHQPAFVSTTLGTTSTLAIDPLEKIGPICNARNIWLHVDAAMAGTALICPEMRQMAAGVEHADSFTFNPHKWMLTNFDCNVFYVPDPIRLNRAMSVMPEYLNADQPPEIINYRDWHIPLGRRFRALKLWFVLRSYGADALRDHVRRHIALAQWFASQLRSDDRFTIEPEPSLNLVCFRLAGDTDDPTRTLLKRINDSGRIHCTHTMVNGRFTIRLCIGQQRTQQSHIAAAWELICTLADEVV
jgi:aromatic-L-amino-acid decarboxylase